MIKSISFKNFYSYSSLEKISFVANKGSRLSSQTEKQNRVRFLKGLVCFGANASGKTNLIRTINSCKNMIIDGLDACGDFLPRISNRANEANMDSYISFNIIINNANYLYEISINCKNFIIKSEKLTLNNKKIIFDREYNNGKYKYKYNISIKDKNDENKLKFYFEEQSNSENPEIFKNFFLSKINKNVPSGSNFFDHIKNVYKTINDIVVIFPTYIYKEKFALLQNNDANEFKNELQRYVPEIKDIILEDYSFNALLNELKENNNFSESDFLKDLNNSASLLLYSKLDIFNVKKINDKIKAKKMIIKHKNNRDFCFGEESTGTCRLFDLLPLLSIKKDERLILIDEIDRSLHTKIVREYIRELFSGFSTNNLQFIITTHDINLLDLSLLRQDEILFIDIDQHSSKIAALRDKDVRFDKDIIKEYLNNAFGGVPNIK